MIESGRLSWQKIYPLKYSERDADGRLKASVLLGLLEDLAWEAADRIGIGYADVSSRNIAWFLLKYRMEFLRYPEKEQSLLIKTEARGLSRLYAVRDFEIYAPEGELLARVSSTWGLINLADKSLLRPNSVFSWMHPLGKREDDLSFTSLRALENADVQKTFQVRYDDIDINRHVNNACYLGWALETLPHNLRGAHTLKTVDILFKREADLSFPVLSQAVIGEGGSEHILKNQNTDEALCLIRTQFS